MRLRRLGASALPVVLLMGPVGGWACAGDKPGASAGDVAAESVAYGDAAASDPEPASSSEELLDPNEAASAELAAVEGMTAHAVAALEVGRPFATMVGVHAVLSGAIGDEAAREAYERIWLPISLNDAAREEILLIPGVGGRMAHEFEEYRPYADMEQFRREIGKYVDDDEVARLERYVTLH